MKDFAVTKIIKIKKFNFQIEKTSLAKGLQFLGEKFNS